MVDGAETVFVGIDVGGTNTGAGVVDAKGRLLATVKKRTETSDGDALVRQLAEMARELLTIRTAKAGLISSPETGALRAVGVGIPGFLDARRGVVRHAANLPLRDFPLADRLSALLGVPVILDNDVRMYAYGEAAVGAAAGYDDALVVTVGTGLAAAVVHRGRLLTGGDLAGEIGHVKVDGNEYACGCGMNGCLETLVSAGGIVRQAKERMRWKPSVLGEWFPERPEAGQPERSMTAEDVTKAADLGDAVAAQVFERTGRVLGSTLAVAAMLLGTDVIVIGGGVSRAGERLLSPVRRALAERVHPLQTERVKVTAARWTDEAGVIGSALAAKARGEHTV
jgi:glucokinase